KAASIRYFCVDFKYLCNHTRRKSKIYDHLLDPTCICQYVTLNRKIFDCLKKLKIMLMGSAA
ncbi:MAG TPA: hypothetical protein VE445_10925, partial [Nitrososphaeraceae archaeon]|nr:hypothetical protein [Nitrososphaeraceae archaeon]